MIWFEGDLRVYSGYTIPYRVTPGCIPVPVNVNLKPVFFYNNEAIN